MESGEHRYQDTAIFINKTKSVRRNYRFVRSYLSLENKTRVKKCGRRLRLWSEVEGIEERRQNKP